MQKRFSLYQALINLNISIILFMILIPSAEAHDSKKESEKWGDQFRNPIERMREMSRRMSQLFDNHPQSFNNIEQGPDNDLKISHREDGKNIYIDVAGDGVKNDGLNIDIKNGMIKLSGEIKKTVKNETENGSSYSSYSSYFSRSLNVPRGAVESSAEFEKKKDKLIIKFKKRNII